MNQPNYFPKIIWTIILLIAAAAAIHFIRAYERLTAEAPEIAVTLPEGSSVYDEDRILSAAGVIDQGQLIAAAGVGARASSSGSLEGKLFPDTYYFYPHSSSSVVLQKMLDDFAIKAEPLFAAEPQDATNTKNAEQDLIIASILEKEVPSSTDQAIVAGIIEKRLAQSMPLDIDATICYIKEQKVPTSTAGCYPLSAADFKIDSPYNTYLHKGLPPTPISNPGVVAIQAALHPATSSYIYYLSDPKTGETIYAKTLQEQEANQRKYLTL